MILWYFDEIFFDSCIFSVYYLKNYIMVKGNCIFDNFLKFICILLIIVVFVCIRKRL